MRCAAITKGGDRCKLEATSGSYCWSHAPENAQERKRRARRAGKAKGAHELSEVKALLADLTARVLQEVDAEPLETGRAAVANQLINTRLRAIEVERKVKETDELERRLEALERITGGGKRWGA